MASLTKVNLSDPISSHVRRDFTRLDAGQTIAEAMDWLRANPPQERIIYFYVLDRDGRLCGVVPTRRLILGTPATRIADIMVKQVVAIPGSATVLEACEFFIQHRLLAFPVVDEERRLLGVADVELYTEELQDLGDVNNREDLFQLLGVHLAKGKQMSAWSAFRDRFPWLSCNLAAGILAALLSGVFAAELKRVVALAFFIPVVLNLAESVSSQSVSLALHGFHGHRPSWRSLLSGLRQEVATGFLLGIGTGAAVALAALVWQGDTPRLALCLIGGISIGVVSSAALGLTIPTLLRLLHLEPRVAAGPIVLASADIVTILAYFNLARWLLG
jgi:magnesium transporter